MNEAMGGSAAGQVDLLGAQFPPLTVGIFLTIFAFSLVMDLFLHRDHKDVSTKDAAAWSIFWIALALGFAGWLKFYHGKDHPEWASLFLTGYVLEKTLSFDNLLGFIAIFRVFEIRSGLQHRILYYGILGALFFRALFVVLGASVLNQFGGAADIVFGAIVLYAAYQMAFKGDDGEDSYEDKPTVKALTGLFKTFLPQYPRIVGERFFITREEAEQANRESGRPIELKAGARRFMTSAFQALLVVEGCDIVLSFDSVPAVISVSRDPFIIYTAIIFAILGLRSLYFIIQSLVDRLSRLESALLVVLVFIGVKMFIGAAAHYGYPLPWWGQLGLREQANYSLAFVLSVLTVGVVASFLFPAREEGSAAEGEG